MRVGSRHEPAGGEPSRPGDPAPHDRGLAGLAIGETVILLHPPLPLVGVSIAMERDRQQNDSLANG